MWISSLMPLLTITVAVTKTMGNMLTWAESTLGVLYRIPGIGKYYRSMLASDTLISQCLLFRQIGHPSAGNCVSNHGRGESIQLSIGWLAAGLKTGRPIQSFSSKRVRERRPCLCWHRNHITRCKNTTTSSRSYFDQGSHQEWWSCHFFRECRVASALLVGVTVVASFISLCCCWINLCQHKANQHYCSIFQSSHTWSF